MAKYEIIDADTHLSEPADVWTSRVPSSMKDKVPRVINNDDGTLSWVMGNNAAAKMLSHVGLHGVAGVKDWTKNPPKTYEEMNPGATDPHERLKYMDQQRMWAMVLYPNVAGFGNHNFLNLKDRDLMLTCVQVYNDFQTEWASADPRRLLPITSTPFWDVEASVKEIRRCHAMGHKGILFTGSPESFGCPYFGDPHWNPLWEVAVELDLPISFHIGSGGVGEDMVMERTKLEGRLPVFSATGTQLFLGNSFHLSNLLMSGVLIRYPEIKFVSVESGIGWIPFMLEAMDWNHHNLNFKDNHPEFEMLPSEYFKRNIYACYWFEEIAPRQLFDTMGVDNILFETDFPHPACLYAETVWDQIEKGLGDCQESVRRKVLFENAQKLYKVELPTAADEERLGRILAENKPFWKAA